MHIEMVEFLKKKGRLCFAMLLFVVVVVLLGAGCERSLLCVF